MLVELVHSCMLWSILSQILLMLLVCERVPFQSRKGSLEVVTWVFRYLLRTTKTFLQFGGFDPILEGYTDSILASGMNGIKSTLSYVYTFTRGVVLWQHKLQKCVALSTMEAKYIASIEGGN